MEQIATTNPTSPPPEQPHHKILPIVLIVIALLGFVMLTLLLRSNNKPMQKETATTSKAVTPSKASAVLEKGKMYLKPTQNKTTYSSSEPITVTLFANSDAKPITGYDVVITFDPAAVSFTSAKGLVADYQDPITRKDNGNVSLFSFKKLSSQNSIVFTDTALADITFKPLRAGSVTFSILFTPPSTRDSNLMTEEKKTHDILGSVQGTTVTVTK